MLRPLSGRIRKNACAAVHKSTRGSPQHIYQPTPKHLQRKQFHRYKKKNENFSCRSLLQSHVSTGSWCVCSTANGRLHDRIHKVSVSRFPGRLHMHVQAVQQVAMRKIRPREIPDLRWNGIHWRLYTFRPNQVSFVYNYVIGILHKWIIK